MCRRPGIAGYCRRDSGAQAMAARARWAVGTPVAVEGDGGERGAGGLEGSEIADRHGNGDDAVAGLGDRGQLVAAVVAESCDAAVWLGHCGQTSRTAQV